MTWEIRIRELRAKALAARTDDELESAIAELRVASREHMLSAQNTLYSYPVLRRDPDVILN